MRLDLAAIREHEPTPIIRGSIDFDTGVTHRDHPRARSASVRPAQLLMPLSQVVRMIDHRRGHNQTSLGLTGDKRMKPSGNSSAMKPVEPSLAPARMLHQRDRRDVVPMPSMTKASSAVACASIAGAGRARG
jgi:hypothetical protein